MPHLVKTTMLSPVSVGLRARLILLFLLAIIPALGLILYSYSQQRERGISEIQANALRLSRLAASEHENRIENARTLLVTLSRLPEVHGSGMDACVACEEIFTDLLKRYPNYASLGAADLNGDVFCSGKHLAEPINIADRSFFQRALQSGNLAFRDYRMGSLTQKSVMSLGYPIIDANGQVEGVVFAEQELVWLDRFMTQAGPPEGSALRLLDGDGRILAHSPDAEGLVGSLIPNTDFIIQMASQGEGVTEAAGTDGVTRLYSFVRVSNTSEGPMYVSIGIPTEIAFAETNRGLIRNLMAFGLVTVLAILSSWGGGSFFIVRPVDALLKLTRRIAAGDLAARTGVQAGGGELHQLALAFDRMAETLEQRDVERKHAEEKIMRGATRAEALVRVAGRLNAKLDLRSVLNAVCEETSRALNVPVSIVNLYDESKGTLHCVTERGLPPGCVEQMKPIPRERFEQYTRQWGSAFVVPDVQSEAGLFEPAFRDVLDVQTAAVASMLRDHQLVGVLCVLASDENRRFSQDDLTLLKGLADQAAQAITNARLHALLQLEGQRRAHLIHKIITAQEDERNRIARELHDQTVQDVTLLMMNLDLGRMNGGGDPAQADKHLQRSRSIAEEMLYNLRRIIGDLRPSQLDDLGPGPAIAWYGEQRLKPLGLSLVLSGNALERRLPRMMETALFRIAQEALTNSVKHSSAWQASVNLDVMDGQVIMKVKDDGKGFVAQTVGLVQADGGGLGLSGMKERATLLGGEFELQTAPGQGTTITVRLPLAEEVHHD